MLTKANIGILTDQYCQNGVIQPLPREAFQIKEPIEFHGDWLDTEESQRLLKFQRHDIHQHYEAFW